MFLTELHKGHRIMYKGGKIVLDTSEPLKLYYLEPWQMSSKYLKKIKMNFPFGVLLNLHNNIWLPQSMQTAQGLFGAFQGTVTFSPASPSPFAPPEAAGANLPMQVKASLEFNESPF